MSPRGRFEASINALSYRELQTRCKAARPPISAGGTRIVLLRRILDEWDEAHSRGDSNALSMLASVFAVAGAMVVGAPVLCATAAVTAAAVAAASPEEKGKKGGGLTERAIRDMPGVEATKQLQARGITPIPYYVGDRRNALRRAVGLPTVTTPEKAATSPGGKQQECKEKVLKRPPGRAPKGKVWDPTKGYVEVEPLAHLTIEPKKKKKNQQQQQQQQQEEEEKRLGHEGKGILKAAFGGDDAGQVKHSKPPKPPKGKDSDHWLWNEKTNRHIVNSGSNRLSLAKQRTGNYYMTMTEDLSAWHPFD